MQSFEVGENVSILDESGVFTIKEILQGKARIEDEFGFEQWIDLKFIVKRRSITVDRLQKKDETGSQLSKNNLKSNSFPEIDLHIECLLPSDSQMSAHDKFTLQIEQFKRFTNLMIQRKVTKFRVIHGSGEGRLKSEIRSMVQSRVGFTIHDDNFANGKVGASLIELQVTKVVPF